MVNHIVRLMDNLKFKKAHIGGYSMSAMMVLKFILTHPDRTMSAIMAGHGGVREDAPNCQFKKTRTPVFALYSVESEMVKP